MRVAIMCLALLWIAEPGLAARIRSGEHADFSRLVVEFDRTPAWSLAKTDAGYVLLAEELSGAVDLSRVFYYIPRSRVSDLRQDRATGQLWIDLACPCAVEAFEIARNRLVIDVRDPAARPEALVDKSQIRLPAEPILPLLPSEPAPTDRAALDPAARQDITTLRSNLARGLALAMSEGLIEPSDQEPAVAAVAPLPEPHRAAPGPQSRPRDAAIAAGHVQVRTTPSPGPAPEAAPETPCREVSQLALTAPTGPGGPDHRGAMTVALFDAAGRFSPDAARAMAVFHLARGFGAEAVETLNLGDLPPAGDDPLMVAAALIDGLAPRGANPFFGDLECGAPDAVWDALARSDIPPLDEQQRRALFRSVLMLPEEIREPLGGRLVARLFSAGETGLSAAIRAYLDRTSRSAPDPDVTAAQLLLIEGKTQAAIDELDGVIARGGTAAVTALITRLEVGVSEPATVGGATTDLARLARTFETEFRRTEQGQTLGRARRAFEVAQGDLLPVLRELLPADQTATPAAIEEAVALLETAVSRANRADIVGILSDGALLGVVLSAAPAVTDPLLKAAIGLGLPALAEQVLQTSEALGAEQEALARARIALLRRQPTRALVALSGFTSPPAEDLRWRAQAMQLALEGRGPYDAAQVADAQEQTGPGAAPKSAAPLENPDHRDRIAQADAAIDRAERLIAEISATSGPALRAPDPLPGGSRP